MVQKIFNNQLFRVMSTWFGNYIQSLWNEREARYAGAVYLTQAEYDALSEEEKMDATKTYFITE